MSEFAIRSSHIAPFGIWWGWLYVGFYLSLIGTMFLYLSSFLTANSKFIVDT